MYNLITLIANNGTEYRFMDEIIASSSMADVYFSLDKKCILRLFRNPVGLGWRGGRDIRCQTKQARKLLDEKYSQLISKNAKGEYWRDFFNYPLTYVEWDGRFGVITPTFSKQFFVESGRFQGKEKGTKWFISAKLRNKFLEANQKGTWNNYFLMCLKIAQMTKLLHQVGLVFSDLSYNTFLIDPLSGSACLTSYDQLKILNVNNILQTIPALDFVAPETFDLKKNLLKNCTYLDLEDRFSFANDCYMPNIETNNHALAVLVYMLLLYRHPLRGGKVHNMDSAKDEELTMGEKALFIEHPTDKSNAPNIEILSPLELPQGDINKLPYTICGPYLKDLFDKAFIDGLHNPVKRPIAEDWVTALSKTMDLLLPCKNPVCESKWFVFDNSTKPRCPFCGKEYSEKLAILNLYYQTDKGTYLYENYRLMIYDKQYLYKWHINNLTTSEDMFLYENRIPVGDFYLSNGKWYLRNLALDNLYDKDLNIKIEIGNSIELSNGKKILLSVEDGGRLVVVQLTNSAV